LLNTVRYINLQPEEFLFKEGEIGQSLFIVVQGNIAAVSAKGEQE
jgi:CRP-like cAMP-binding protein